MLGCQALLRAGREGLGSTVNWIFAVGFGEREASLSALVQILVHPKRCGTRGL